MKNILLKTLTHTLALTAGLFIAVQLMEAPVYYIESGDSTPVSWHEPIDYNMWELTFLRSLPHKA
jgi:hypothetical protein